MTRKLYLRSLLALFAAAALACGDETQPTVSLVTFEVTAPTDTPPTANLYVVSEHYSLGEAGLKLQHESATRFRGQAWLPRGENISYRLVLRGPDAAEVSADGTQVVAARTVEVRDGAVTVPLTVRGWKVSQAPAGEPAKVSFVVTVPANTPADATVYLIGGQPEIGGWTEKSGFLLTRNAQGKYTGTVTFAANAGSNVEYKVYRGTWATVEKTPEGGEIANRKLNVPRQDTTVEFTVDRWADITP